MERETLNKRRKRYRKQECKEKLKTRMERET